MTRPGETKAKMGVFRVDIEVGDLSGEQFLGVQALVDTGSSYTSLPARLLARLGVLPTGQRPFRQADDRIVQRQTGHARFRLNGDEVITPVVFDPANAEPLLGALTLEAFGLGVDLVNQQLISITHRI